MDVCSAGESHLIKDANIFPPLKWESGLAGRLDKPEYSFSYDFIPHLLPIECTPLPDCWFHGQKTAPFWRTSSNTQPIKFVSPISSQSGGISREVNFPDPWLHLLFLSDQNLQIVIIQNLKTHRNLYTKFTIHSIQLLYWKFNFRLLSRRCSKLKPTKSA